MNLDGQQILITGGAGFIGSHLVDALSRHSVRVLDDFSTGNRANLEHHADNPNIEIIDGDIRDRHLVTSLMRDVDVVFHLACRGVRHSIGNPEESHAINAGGTLTLLQAAREASVKRFVHVSSSEVYGTAQYVPMDEAHPCCPETVYGAAKLAGEAYARAYHNTYGLPTVVVRPFNNFGPRSHFEGDSGEVIPRFAVWALNGRPPIIFGDGTQTRDFIFVEETARWLCKVAETDRLVGQTVNLGSGKETSIRELAAIVYEEAGRPDLVPIFRERRPGDVQRHLSGSEFAHDTLGFATETSVRAGISKLLNFLKERQSAESSWLDSMADVNWTTTSTTPQRVT